MLPTPSLGVAANGGLNASAIHLGAEGLRALRAAERVAGGAQAGHGLKAGARTRMHSHAHAHARACRRMQTHAGAAASAGAAGTVGRARQVIEINLVLIGPGNVAMQLAHALVRERFADSATALRK